MGSVQTGTQHPSRRLISHPSSPVPSGSNVASSANPQRQVEENVRFLREKSHLLEVMNEETTEFSSAPEPRPTGNVIEKLINKEYLTECQVSISLEMLKVNEELQGRALPASKLVEHLKNRDPALKEFLMNNSGEIRRAIEEELRRKMIVKSMMTDD
jgi:hypothetical protein